MKNTVKQFQIQEIIFETGDSEVLVKGKAQDGLMSYLSEFIINHSQLNSLLNHIKSLNEAINLEKLFRTEAIYDGGIMYSADLSGYDPIRINTDTFETGNTKRRIRA